MIELPQPTGGDGGGRDPTTAPALFRSKLLIYPLPTTSVMVLSTLVGTGSGHGLGRASERGVDGGGALNLILARLGLLAFHVDSYARRGGQSFVQP